MSSVDVVTGSTGQSDRRREALQSELAHVREQISGFLRSGDQVLTIFVTIVIALVIGLSSHYSTTIAVLAPLVLIVPGAYTVRLNALIQHLGGYRKALEERLNDELGDGVYFWEAAIAPIVKRPTTLASQAAFAMLWITLVSAAVVSVAWSDWSLWWLLPLTIAYSAVVVVVGAGVLAGNRLFERTYLATKEAISPAVPGDR